MELISVLTPTYNRKDLLKKLYLSLSSQSDKNFEWIVVDDGSNDDTDIFINSIISNAEFPIRFYKKTNGGKHTALNFGIKKINTPLTFIVDSDDYLTEDAIFSIKRVYQKYYQEKDLCGFSFLRGKPQGGYLSDSGVPRDGMKESFLECRVNRNIGGDMAEVWFTKCLKEIPFPEFPGEKFLGEDIVWLQLSRKYKMRFFNKVIYISDYLNDGLTNNRRKHNITSPKGCMMRAEVFLNFKTNFKITLKSILQYYIYGRFAKYKIKNLYINSNRKVLFIIAMIPAELLYQKWKLEFKRG